MNHRHEIHAGRTNTARLTYLLFIVAGAIGCGDAPLDLESSGDTESAVTPAAKPPCTYHFSTSGNDAAPGTLAAPKRTLAHAASLMTPGAVICLKRGDIWWLGAGSWSVSGKAGTSAKPIVVQDYGTGNLPVVAALEAWTSGWQSAGGGRFAHALVGYSDVKRLIIDGHGRKRVALADLNATNEYAVDGGKVYVSWNPSASFTEVVPAAYQNALRIANSSYVTFRNIRFGGGHNNTIAALPPTSHVSLEGLEVRKWGGQGIFFQHSGGSGYHESPAVVDSVLDKVWSADENLDPYDAAGPGGDGIWFSETKNGVIRHNRIIDSGHCAISVAVDVDHTLVEQNETRAVNNNYQHAICLGGNTHDNVIRRNFFRDQRHATAHLNGVNNRIYSNLFIGSRATPGTRNLAPHGADISDFESEMVKGNVYAHNTFYDTDWSSVAIYDGPGQGTIGQHIFKNNLFVRFGQSETHPGYGIIMGGQKNAEQIVAHNLFWRTSATEKVIFHYNAGYTAAQADAAFATFVGNLQADPQFVAPDDGNFHVKSSSPARAAGEDLSAVLGAGYVDFDGKPFDAKHPTLGAFQY